jgi:hypothetical protein
MENIQAIKLYNGAGKTTKKKATSNCISFINTAE